jgi:hypothetical protein
MACAGLHCSGCAGGVSVPPVVFAAAFGFAWVAENVVMVAAVSAVSGALAVAAVVALMRWADRRNARHAVEHPLAIVREVPQISTVRADSVAQIRTARADLGTSAERPAITPAVINLHFHGADGEDTAARIIRTAISGDAITGEGPAAVTETQA